MLRRLTQFTLALLAIVILYANIRLYDSPTCVSAPAGYINADVIRQLRFLQRVLHQENAGEAMQALYPEGYVFVYALYGLAWCEVADALDASDPLREEAVREIALCLQALDSSTGKAVFNPDLPLAYGAFYQGWATYLRGRYLPLASEAHRHQTLQQFQSACDAIARAIAQTDAPYLESYRGASWPADNIVCLAALALHDRMVEPRYRHDIRAWVERIKRTASSPYKLLPHSCDLENSSVSEDARGSSQSLMLVFLSEIDSAFAAEQYRQYRHHFLAHRLGLPGIREYPAGVAGQGDIDSGPVVGGIGGAATIVGIKVAQRFNDWDLAVALHSGVEMLLFPKQSQMEKMYLFGKLPILDAFLAWSNAGLCNAAQKQAGAWRRGFQLWSLGLLALVGLTFWTTTKKRGSATTAPPQP